MNAPARFAYANARLHALKRDLWNEPQIAQARAAPALSVRREHSEFAEVYPPLVRWFTTLLRASPPAATAALLALFRRHEIENLKVLWRAAVRNRPIAARWWRPLAPLAAISLDAAATSLPGLVERLKGTPYASLAVGALRSHGTDLGAAEFAFDGWTMARLLDAARSLPPSESPARDLLLWQVRARDLDILRRGGDAYRLEPAFAVGLTVLLPRECPRAALAAMAAWRPAAGSLAALAPRWLAQAMKDARDWDTADAALRARQRADCRRALRLYPFQVAPSIAAVLLREEQMRFVAGLATAYGRPA